MNEPEVNRFEAELRSLRPARPSIASVDRVLEQVSPRSSPRVEPAPRRELMNLLRWLIPAAAASVLVVTLMTAEWSPVNTSARLPTAAAAPDSVSGSETHSNFAGLRADRVEIDRQLVAQFDTVAQLPDGQPLRVRCERWMDTIQLRDSSRGLVLERTAPRLEIVPIGFETY
jgi:hypothetical protein